MVGFVLLCGFYFFCKTVFCLFLFFWVILVLCVGMGCVCVGGGSFLWDGGMCVGLLWNFK